MTPVLAHERVAAPGATPRSTAWLLHGIFGSRRNWRGFARALVQHFPDWQLVLVDLRNHGGSHGTAPPHTVAACAQDLQQLAAAVGAPDALVGHSFAVKVVLLHAASAPRLPGALWLLDGPAGAETAVEHSEVARMVTALRALPPIVPARTVVAHALRDAGFTPALATWMASNLEPGPDGQLRWHFALDAVAAMLADYWRVDAWEVLEAVASRTRVHVVVGARSDRFTPVDLERFAALATRGVLTLHTVQAGHWLHVDDPQGLLAAMAATFAAAPG